MLIKELDYSRFLESNRWDAIYFNMDSSEFNSKFDLIKLKNLVKERKLGIESKRYPSHKFNYIGLENIEPNKGCLVDFEPRLGSEIKSRSKVFRYEDVLFGRLRPNLNKVYCVGDSLVEGVCSTEFFVLVSSDKILPTYLEAILSSDYIKNKVVRLVSGATLPRVSINEFLDLEIPVPPLETQSIIANFYIESKLEREVYKHKASMLVEECRSGIVSFLSGNGELKIDMNSFNEKKWKNPLPDLEV
ncbi:restriction endonuclease subunit S [Vibrio alginolyticus]|uniref:restriction endonuclease subunit S n=1 Tax=Vibrio sp. JC34 TaxID=3042470 RepID=UPI002AFB6C7F|nr:restriction endonuclease subunit S [Vibrio alginolyticus]